MKQLYEKVSFLFDSETEMKQVNKEMTEKGFKVIGKSRSVEDMSIWIVYYEKLFK